MATLQPRQFGRYQVVRELGRGAMGLVFEGLDPKLNRRVAIKVIRTQRLKKPEHLADYSARFVHEAQAVARLNHPHIVTVHDFGEEDDGTAYLVMELIAGEELSGYFGEAQAFQLEFTIEDSVRMSCELLDALGYAHRNGIIHRDVKPANVMLTTDLKVKLTDFGVAQMAGISAGDESAMVGTPSFMSPEQITGQSASPRSDIFAAGLILYQFLTTERAFRGQSLFGIQQKILYEEPMPPSLVNPQVNPVFDRIVQRALAKRPEERYQDAASFRDDLQRALNGEPVGQYHTQPPPLTMAPAAREPQQDDADATIIERPALAPTLRKWP